MLRGQNTNINSIATRGYYKLNGDAKSYVPNRYFDGKPPIVPANVRNNPITQVQRILQIAPILADSAPPTYTSNTVTVFNYGSPVQVYYLGRINRFSSTKVEMTGTGYTINLPVLLEPLLIYVMKFIKTTDTGTYTIYAKSNEKISYNNGKFRSVKFNSTSKKNDYILIVNINISNYNSEWLVIGMSDNSSGFDFEY